MPTLILLRHMKSSWDSLTDSDFDRPLAPRGERAAAAVSVYLKQRKVEPDLVLCSAAQRTVETCERLRGAFPKSTPVNTTREIYEVSPGRLLDVIGHGHGCENTSSWP